MKAITSEKAPAAIGPYSQAIEVGNVVYLSGQIPIDPAVGELADGIRNQTEQVLKNLKNVLSAAGLTMAQVVKTTVYLADMADFAAMNEVYAAAFSQPFPARVCIQAAALPKNARVEIDCIAVRDN